MEMQKPNFKLVGECDNCGKEDAKDVWTGLCPTCLEKKPIINVIDRKKEFYADDMESIKEKEDDWGELEILENLTEPCDYEEVCEVDRSAKGVVICWNAKDEKIEVLNYKY